jgi:hypothetical protein
MAASSRPKSSAERVRDFRARQRAQGLKLVQFWVPDVTSEAFKQEARRQSLAISRSAHAKADQDFIDSITIKWWEERE